MLQLVVADLDPSCFVQRAHYFHTTDAKVPAVEAYYLTNILSAGGEKSFTTGESKSILFVPGCASFNGCYYNLDQSDPQIHILYSGTRYWVGERAACEE